VLVLQGGCEDKAIEECRSATASTWGFARLQEGARPSSINVRLDNGYRYSEQRGAKIRVWRSAR
jgi:hypothetical protein